MFTGIVEKSVRIVGVAEGPFFRRLTLANPWTDLKPGESIAVNGCCLTVVEAGNELGFDLSPETLSRTTLGGLRAGSIVNMERAMRADGRLGGHLVQGHVDGTGSIVRITPEDGATVFRFRVPDAGAKYIIDKGSVALDGISLTAVKPEGSEFDTWIIPHTLIHTNLNKRVIGDSVNVEFDVLARYAEKLLSGRI